MIKIQIEIDDRAVTQMLQRLIDAAQNPRPALLEVGEDLVESTKRRFETQTAPDGSRWERNSPVTIKRKGRDQPLTGRGTLMDQINYQITGNDTLDVGSPTIYAAMQQFGGRKSEFPNLWGDIPARPFIGVSADDEQSILNTFINYLRDQI
jgi:phage virion morphogenesis protein